ncbi:MAG TPA: hypothetical protein VFN48_04445 [Solirubrobacteraceae bacterium]|nr:hypothetical protein [Solirubrobacteraceae bacterium]
MSRDPCRPSSRRGARGAAVMSGPLRAGILLLALAGCGRASAPPVGTTATPTAFRTLSVPAAGVRLRVPADWTVTPGQPPLMDVISSGSSIIALWRYSTRVPPPRTGAGVSAALTTLERRARRRDRTFRVQRAGTGRLQGAPVIILDATETISGRLRRVRSEHVLLRGSELVLEAYSPPAAFPHEDHLVFSPVRKSLSLDSPEG